MLLSPPALGEMDAQQCVLAVGCSGASYVARTTGSWRKAVRPCSQAVGGHAVYGVCDASSERPPPPDMESTPRISPLHGLS
jgi:hypothetical protein